MDQARVILTIEAVSERAADALKHPHNARRYVAPTFSKSTEKLTRQATPEIGARVGASSKVVLTFDQPPKDGLHFVFGSDRDECDVYIGPQSERISGRHFVVYYDDHKRLVLKDTSRSGSILYYAPKFGSHRRKDFTWILFRNMNIIFAANNGPTFRLRVDCHASYEAEYLKNISRFMFTGYSFARRYDYDVSILEFGSHSSAAAVSRTQSDTPSKNSVYHFIQKVGSGGFGTVYKVVDVSTGRVYAGKKFDNGTARKEVRLLKRIEHPHIVQFVGFAHQVDELLLMEYLALGSLRQCSKVKQISKNEIVQCLMQGVDALMYLQENGISHRDIKPDNILVQHRAEDEACIRTKLADFGLGKDKKSLKSHVGTPPYTAPEIVEKGRGSRYLPFTVDTWSLGVVFLEYYEELNISKHYDIQQKMGLPHGSWCQWLEDTMRSLQPRFAREPVLAIAEAMLQKNSDDRANARECLTHVQGTPALLEVLRQSCRPLARPEPVFWEDRLKTHYNHVQGPQLYVDIIGSSKPESQHFIMPELLLDAIKPSNEDGSESGTIPEFKTVTDIRRQRQQQQQQEQSSNLNSDQLTVKPPQKVSRSVDLPARQGASEIRSSRMAGLKPVRQAGKRSILAPVRRSSKCSITKEQTIRCPHSAPSRMQATFRSQAVPPDCRSLYLWLEKERRLVGRQGTEN